MASRSFLTKVTPTKKLNNSRASYQGEVIKALRIRLYFPTTKNINIRICNSIDSERERIPTRKKKLNIARYYAPKNTINKQQQVLSGKLVTA